jgi:hypothetical protein
MDVVVTSVVLIVELSKSAVIQGSNDSTEDARRRVSTGRSGIFCRVILGERSKQYMTYSTQAVYHDPAVD